MAVSPMFPFTIAPCWGNSQFDARGNIGDRSCQVEGSVRKSPMFMRVPCIDLQIGKSAFGTMATQSRRIAAMTIKESLRSEELRSELREQGYAFGWDVVDEQTRVSYWNNGRGKAILVLEHAV